MLEKEIFAPDKWPSFLQKAVRDYTLFSEQSSPLEAKDFITYHNACKAALGHILLIYKILQAIPDTEEKESLLSLLDQARKATHDTEDIGSFD